MKKTFCHKCIILLFCVLLTASLCVVPVSAEDTDNVEYVNTYFNMSDNTTAFSVAFKFGTTTYSDLLDTIDETSFYKLENASRPYVTKDVNEYYYEYMFSQYDDTDVVTNSFGVFSIAFLRDRVELPWLESIYTKVVMNRGYLKFFGSNAIVDGVRFSLRLVEDDYITTTFLKSSTFDPGFSFSEDSAVFRTYYYDGLDAVSTIQFGSGTAISTVAPAYTLCIDFLFRPLAHHDFTSDSIAISVDTSSNFSLLNYLQSEETIIGPESPSFRPELDLPYYSGPSTDSFSEMASLESGLVDLSGASSSLAGINTNVQSGFGAFTLAFKRIGSILTYATDTIPHLEYVIYFSLAFGLLAFVIGLGGSIIGASIDAASTRSAAVRKREEAKEAIKAYKLDKGK